MKKAVLALLLACVSLFAGLVGAQTVDMPGMINGTGNTPLNQISGFQNPEQIPLLVIARLWFESVSYNGKVDLNRISQTGLNPNDQAVLVNIANDLYNTRASLNATQAAISTSTNYDDAGYWNDSYNAINAAIASLENQMSAPGFLLFENFLESKKAGASVSPIDFGLGSLAVTRRKELSMVASAAGQGPTGMTTNYSTYTDIVGSSSYDEVFTNEAQHFLDSTWSAMYGKFWVTGGLLQPYGNGYALVYLNSQGALPPGGCQSTVLGSPGYSSNSIGPALLKDASNFYLVNVYNGGIYLQKVAGGQGTYLQNVAYTAASGDKLTVCSSYNSSTGKTSLVGVVNRGGTNIITMAATDASSPFSTVYPALWGYYSGAGANWTVSEFTADIVTMSVISSISGNTICSGTICNGVTHTPRVENTNGVIGGTIYGAGVAPQTGINLQYTVVYPFDGPAPAPGPVTTGGGISCSRVGDFFDQFFNKQVEAAWTNVTINQYYGLTIYGYKYGIGLNCPNTTTPDWNPTPTTYSLSNFQSYPSPQNKQITGFSACYRNGTSGPWTCVGHFWSPDYNYPKSINCTVNP